MSMEITDVRMALAHGGGGPLLAYLDIVLDDELVIHNLKLVEGKRGVFLCMPGKERRDACKACRKKNPLQNNFCGHCGAQLPPGRAQALLPGRDGRVHLFQDVVHPITTDLRDYFLKECVGALERERQSPGSVKPLTAEQDTPDEKKAG